jgi:hypothetical protein
MAEFRKNEGGVRESRDGVELAGLCTPPVVSATGLINLRNEDVHGLSLGDDRFEEKVGIGFFHIAVEKKQSGFPWIRS